MSTKNKNSLFETIKQITGDGWENVLTGIGVKGKDKRMSAHVKYNLMTEHRAEEMYAGDDMAQTIVDILPEEMMREGFELQVQDDTKKIKEAYQSYLEEKDLLNKISEGLTWGRLYGGCGTYLGIADGQKADMPVDENNIKGIEFATNLNRYELEGYQIDSDPESKYYGLPTLYRITPTFGGAFTQVVHRSRIIRWDGIKLPRRVFIQNNYWHDSVLNKIENSLLNYHTSHDAVAAILQDISQAVFTIKGLADIVASGQDGVLDKRLAMVDAARSVVRAVVIDEDESFTRQTTTLTGLPETLRTVDNRLIASSRVPHTKLFGESPSGLGATGESEKSDWYDTVAAEQKKKLAPQLEMLTRYILLSKDGPTSGIEPKDWKIVFNPLEQMDEKDQVEIREKQAIVDEKYIDLGVVTPDEVRDSRFGGRDYSIDTNLGSDESQLERTRNQGFSSDGPSADL